MPTSTHDHPAVTSASPSADVHAVPVAPFLHGFAAMHRAMRRDTVRLPEAVRRSGSPAAAGELAAWFAAFRRAIEHHHHREDDLVWPELSARDLSFVAHVPSLGADHEALDRALDRVAACLGHLAAGDLDAASDAMAAAEYLRDVLHDHLDREEAAAFPRLGREFTAEEYRAIEQRMVKGLTFADLAYVGPWTVDGLSAGERDELLRLLPVPARLLIRTVFARRYRRIAAPVLAVAS